MARIKEDRRDQGPVDTESNSTPNRGPRSENKFSMEAVGKGVKSLVRDVGGFLQDVSHQASAGATGRHGAGAVDALLIPRPLGAFPNNLRPIRS